MASRTSLLLLRVGVGLIALIFVVTSLTAGTGINPFADLPIIEAEQTVARVNGESIPLKEFLRRFEDERNARGDGKTPLELSEALSSRLPQEVLTSKIVETLLVQLAPRLGVAVSDQELQNVLVKTRWFQKDGQFNREKYREVLASDWGLTELEFERDLRETTTAQKVLGLLTNATTVSEDEVRSYFKTEWNKARVQFARFSPSLYANLELKEADVDAYVRKHGAVLQQQIKSSPKYGQVPERVRLRQILVAVPSGAPETDAKARAAALRAELAGGASFEELARKHSEDVLSARAGGDLGFTEPEMLHPAIAKLAQVLKPNEVSDPVRTEYGFHLVQMVERNKGKHLSPAEQVRTLAREGPKRERSQTMAKEAATKALAQIQAGKDLRESLKDQPNMPAVLDSGLYVPRGENIPQLGPSMAAQAEIAAAEKAGPLSRIHNLEDSWVVVQVMERIRPTEEAWLQGHADARAKLVSLKRQDLSETFTLWLRESSDIFEDIVLMEKNLH